MIKQIQIEDVTAIAREAGEAIMAIYQKDFEVEFKADQSPLTEADKAAHRIIEAGLNRLTSQIPILSEEGKPLPYEERKSWDSFWLVDPVDGTKEFVNKNDEFTVNIALIDQGQPVLGVVFAPALDLLYYAKQGEGAFKEEALGGQLMSCSLPKSSKRQGGEIIVVASKSHMSDETKRFVDELATHNLQLTIHSIGSSLKICLVAEGVADVYPRLGPTMEWDTAAAHAIVLEAGGLFQRFHSGRYMDHCYNKPSLVNDWFVVQNETFMLLNAVSPVAPHSESS